MLPHPPRRQFAELPLGNHNTLVIICLFTCYCRAVLTTLTTLCCLRCVDYAVLTTLWAVLCCADYPDYTVPPTLLLDGPVEGALGKLPHDGVVGGVELRRGPLPRHSALVQKDQPVHRAVDGGVLVRNHHVARDVRALVLASTGVLN
eukprot:9503875-Pyramimonas_sp.AAC.4